MNYRKKPVVIQAVQWKDGKICYQGQVPIWIMQALSEASPGLPGSLMRYGDKVLVYTTEGVMEASDGDWIIRGVNGELYPCKPDVFAKTYEPA